MVNSLLLTSVLAFGVLAGVLLYAAYWAFTIGRSLGVRSYRNQAFGTGLVAASFAIFVVAVDILTTLSESTNAGYLSLILGYGILMTSLMYFVDSSVVASRRLDPLLRDAMRWSRLRYLLWPLFAILAAVNLAIPFNPNPPLWLGLLTVTPALVPGIPGTIALLISRSHSGDLTFRRHLSWFGFFAAFFLTFIVIIGLSPTLDVNSSLSSWQIADYFAPFFPVLGAGYCLYRSAKSLVPLNRISVD